MKRRAWKWALGIFGGMASLLGLVFVEAHWRASRTFERNEREAGEKIAAIRARDWTRPPVSGAAAPGNAWDHFRPALKAIKAIPDHETNLVPDIAGDFMEDEEPDDEFLDAFFAAYRPRIEQLRAGLNCGRVDPGHAYERGGEMDLQYVGEVISAGRFLSGAVAYELRRGRDAEALDLAVLGLGLGQDAARGGPLLSGLVEFIVESTVAEAVREMFEGFDLGPADLQRFAERLDHLEKTRPPPREFLEAEDVYMRQVLLHGDWSTFKVGLFSKETIRPSWRLLFSQRLTRAQGLTQVAAYASGILPLCDRPVHLRSKEADEAARRAIDGTNPLTVEMLPVARQYFKRDAEALLHLALLRVATALAWYEAEKGRPPASLSDLVPRYLSKVPDCPYTGTPLRYAPGRVWSIGGDLKDDGGVYSEPWSVDIDHAGNDVVWWVKRRK